MAGISSRRVAGVLKATGRVSWRDFRSFGSLAGQNLSLFVVLVALEPQSAEFFMLILLAVLLIPLSTDPMRVIPLERRSVWPVSRWEWGIVRVGSLGLSPTVWLALVIAVRAGWKGGLLIGGGGLLFAVAAAVLRQFPGVSTFWLRMIPAFPGVTGSIMRLQWREMLQTLDPYVALTLTMSTAMYRMSGRPLDPAALGILSLVVTLALSTETQVLFALDGYGTERYHLMPVRGWEVLLAKDLAFLGLLVLLVLPLDFRSGMAGGLAALAIGHHRSVSKPLPQVRWRFTSGVLFPDGALQVAALFSAGLAEETGGLAVMGVCVLAWLVSLGFYGWKWDRQRLFL